MHLFNHYEYATSVCQRKMRFEIYVDQLLMLRRRRRISWM